MINNTHKELIIIGASGFGKEVAWLAQRIGITIKGFLDDSNNKSFFNLPVLGNLNDWFNFSGSQFIIAVANPRIRKKILNELTYLGQPEFATLIDPKAVLEIDFVNIGSGSIICAGSICTADVQIEEHCIINKNCSIGHDVKINSFSTISPMVMIGGNVQIEKGVELGASSSIRQGLTVSEGAMVAMGSTVIKAVSSNKLVMGSPAKDCKELPEF